MVYDGVGQRRSDDVPPGLDQAQKMFIFRMAIAKCLEPSDLMLAKCVLCASMGIWASKDNAKVRVDFCWVQVNEQSMYEYAEVHAQEIIEATRKEVLSGQHSDIILTTSNIQARFMNVLPDLRKYTILEE